MPGWLWSSAASPQSAEIPGGSLHSPPAPLPDAFSLARTIQGWPGVRAARPCHIRLDADA